MWVVVRSASLLRTTLPVCVGLLCCSPLRHVSSNVAPEDELARSRSESASGHLHLQSARVTARRNTEVHDDFLAAEHIFPCEHACLTVCSIRGHPPGRSTASGAGIQSRCPCGLASCLCLPRHGERTSAIGWPRPQGTVLSTILGD